MCSERFGYVKLDERMVPMSETLAPSKVTHRDPKGSKFISIVERAYDRAGLTVEEAVTVTFWVLLNHKFQTIGSVF